MSFLQPVLRRSDYPTFYPTAFGDEPETIISRGGSCIINPRKQILGVLNFEREGILTAELDMGDIAREKYDFDVVGHYSWPNIFQLHVNEEPQPGAVGISGPIRVDGYENGPLPA